MRRFQRELDHLFRSRAVDGICARIFRLWVSALTRLPPAEALRRLLLLDDHLLRRVDLLAIELDGGVHAKHRIMRYHEFFLRRVESGERVLDVGCGKGELAFDLAEHGAWVTGIDVNRVSIAFARERHAHERLTLIEADALEWVSPDRFDVVILSNVLEHIEPRVPLLARLAELARPNRVLIRVPVLERDWTVGLRRELGLPYFSDSTHVLEYDRETLVVELEQAGLALDEVEQHWGELWVVATPAGAR